jgi:hypothetical protein
MPWLQHFQSSQLCPAGYTTLLPSMKCTTESCGGNQFTARSAGKSSIRRRRMRRMPPCATMMAGRPIGPIDLLIAAHALSLDLTLVTANLSEFSRVPNLAVENWLD